MDDRQQASREIQRKIVLSQGIYYLAAAVPTVAITRLGWFRRIAGLEGERWYVMNYNTQVALVGAVLTAAGLRQRVSPEIRMLSMIIASGIAAYEVPLGAQGKISPILFADGLAQTAVLASWLASTVIEQVKQA